MDLPDPVAETRRSYDAIAGAYLARKRDRPYDGYLLELLQRLTAALPAGGRVADLGCGHGYEVRALQERGMRSVGVDLSAGMLAHAAAAAPGRLVQGDLRRLPLATASLHGVWSVHALLHVPAADLPAALAEVARVLRPGGMATLSLAGGRGERREEVAYHPGRYRTFVHWSLPDLVSLLGQVGLVVLDQGSAPEAGRDTVWVLAARADPCPGDRTAVG